MFDDNLITNNLEAWTSSIKAKSATGKGDSKKIKLYGVKRLREMIIELAMRGLLVPQVKSDEPAQKLLDKIEADKLEFSKKGKIKKSKYLLPLENELPFQIPQSWIWTQLGKISQIAPRNHLEDDVEVGFVPMALVSSSYQGSHQQEIRRWMDVKKGYTHFANDDIAIAKITPCFENSKAAIFSDLKNGYGAGTTELHVARLIGKHVNSRFILLYLKALMFLEKGKRKMTGSAGQKRIPVSYFASNPLPLPPLKEQQRIVSKVDELMTLCDKLEMEQENGLNIHSKLVKTLLSALISTASDLTKFVESWNRIKFNFDILFTTENSIDQLKQTILQLAVMGKLLPKKSQWSFARFGDIFDIQGGSQPPKTKFISEPRDGYVRLLQIRDLGKNPVPTFIPRELARRFCDEKDILIGRYGASVGKIFKGKKGAYNVALVKLIWSPDSFDQDFLITWLKSKDFQDRLAGASRSAQAGFNKKDLASIQIQYPPLSDQRLIVAKVDQLISICDQLKAGITKTKFTQVTLADSLIERIIR